MSIAKHFRSILDRSISNPKRLFLIDGLGAFLTAFLLGTILTRYEGDFGMPRKVLYPLSLLACVYALYSIGCYFFVAKNWRPFLKAIAMANLMYSFITIGLVIALYQSLTILGILYFSGELIVIGGVIFIELLTVSNNNNEHSYKRRQKSIK